MILYKFFCTPHLTICFSVYNIYLQKGDFLEMRPVNMPISSGSDDGSSSNPNPNPQANCLQNGTVTAISANHGHSLTVSKEDVNAGVEKSYTLSQANTDNHIHQVTISATQFSNLKSNNQITATSTSDTGHSHAVTVSCA